MWRSGTSLRGKGMLYCVLGLVLARVVQWYEGGAVWGIDPAFRTLRMPKWNDVGTAEAAPGWGPVRRARNPENRVKERRRAFFSVCFLLIIRKNIYFPNRTWVGASLIRLIIAYIHPNGSVQVPDQFDPFNPKNASEKNAKMIAIYWSSSKTYEFSRHRYCLALNFGDNGNHLCPHRFEPLTEPCIL